MGYTGVSTVLSAAKLARHREAFVQTLGVETIHDLVELRAQDLGQMARSLEHVASSVREGQ